MRRKRIDIVAAFAGIILFLPAVGTNAAQAQSIQRMEPLPKELEGVGITEKLDTRVPLDLHFTDESGQDVTLGQYFGARRPVILTLVYYSCPMLCTLVLNGMVDALKEIDWVPGQQYEIVTVSFDPLETPTLAKFKKQNYLKEYGRPEAAAGWHFLVGKEDAIQALTQAVGFSYRWDEERRQFAHQAAIYILTPDGRISRYLYGVLFEPKTVRLSLIEAGENKIGSPLDQIILYCFHYDAGSGKYSIAATNIMRVGGILSALAVAVGLSALWRRDLRRRKHPSTGPQA